MTSIKNLSKLRGFTIVELLVVIVVIGVLAAITVVSYTGVTDRANTSSAQAAANAVVQKVGAYSADGPAGSTWAPTMATLTGAGANGTTYKLSGVVYDALATQPADPDTIRYELCGVGAAGAATSYATIATSSGVRAAYWKYDTDTVITTITAGQTSGTLLTWNVTCWPSGS